MDNKQLPTEEEQPIVNNDQHQQEDLADDWFIEEIMKNQPDFWWIY